MAMRPCEKCTENNWKFEQIDGWVRAICEMCGHEVEFRARTIADEPRITEVGQPCRKCSEPVIIRKAGKKSHTYKAYFYCPNCKTIYFSPKFLMTEEDVLKDTLF